MRSNFQTLLVLVLIIISCGTKKNISRDAPTNKGVISSSNSSYPHYSFWKGAEYTEGMPDEPHKVLWEDEMEMWKYVFGELNYPASARNNGVQGTVLVTIIINEFGQPDEIYVSRGVGSGCDEEALEAAERYCEEGFIPAYEGGVPVRVKFDLPVRFKLE